MPLRVLVDVTTWAPERTGVGHYTERLLRAWLRLYPEDQLLLASNTGHGELQDISAEKLGPRMPIRALWMQTALPLQVRRYRPDFSFFPNYLAPLMPIGPFVLTVHDLAVFLYPETFTFKKRVLQRSALPTLVRRAAAILTPSDSTRRDVLRLLPADPRRVVAVPLAPAGLADHAIDAMARQRERSALGLPASYFLAVGTLEPRKNLLRLIRAFESVAARHPDVHLVVAGGRGWRNDEIHAALGTSPAAQRIHSVGYVGSEALQVLYGDALALCYPSLYEGFGLPVVEAMAAGTPVLTSRGSSLDEVAAGAALAVDPTSVPAIAAGMEQILNSPALREELRAGGLRRAASLTWDHTARATRDVFLRLAEGQPPHD